MADSLKKIAALSILVALAFAVPGDCRAFDQPSVIGTQAIPTPAENPANVIVNARTSTAYRILISALGDRIPPTFAGDRLKNTEGFSWYVSQHYALKTDFPLERARHYLTLLELAYPHLVQMFGREPTGIDQKRMAVIYAKDKQKLAQALASDGRFGIFMVAVLPSTIAAPHTSIRAAGCSITGAISCCTRSRIFSKHV